MTPMTVLLIAVALLLILLMLEVPVAWALLTSGLVGVLLLKDVGIAASTASASAFTATSRFSLVVVPMFVLLGLLVMHAGIARDVFDIANRALGDRLRGGLGIATVAACALFAAVTGSSVATVATVGRMAIKEMVTHGYSREFAAGIVSAAGTLGILIPPSIVLVMYGIITGEPIGALLIAGIAPGVLSSLFYGASIFSQARRPGRVAVPAVGGSMGTAADDLEAPQSFWAAMTSLLYVALIFLIVVGGIYTGVFTATQAGAVGAFSAMLLMFIRLARRREKPIGAFWLSLRDTASMTSMIFALLIGGAVFTFFLSSGGYPRELANWVLDLPVAPWVIVVLLLLAMIPLGMILDGLSILLITVPLAYPVVTALGYDGIWFGILVIKMIELGLITPPLGINVYVVAGVSPEVSVEEAFRGTLPFYLVDVGTVALLFAFPVLITWLPAQVG